MNFTLRRDVKFISIEGNIGAGKSTIINQLREYVEQTNLKNKIVFLKEPVDVWESIIEPETGKNMIELFYENPRKWSFAFQIMVFNTQQKLIENTLLQFPEVQVVVSERSVEAGRNIFTRMLECSNDLSSVEKQIYDLLYRTHRYPLYASVFLDISPETCYERVQTRAREGEVGETGIKIEYLKKCDYYYRDWLIEKNELYESPVKVHIVQDNSLQSILPILLSVCREIV